ncbi:MAG: hypothetical protein WCC36_08650 [Gammaproteobacteria bacterium]
MMNDELSVWTSVLIAWGSELVVQDRDAAPTDSELWTMNEDPFETTSATRLPQASGFAGREPMTRLGIGPFSSSFTIQHSSLLSTGATA